MTATAISPAPTLTASHSPRSLRTLWLSTVIVMVTLVAAAVLVLALVLAGGGVHPTHGEAMPRPVPQPTATSGLDR